MKIMYEYKDSIDNLQTDTDLMLIKLSDGCHIELQYVSEIEKPFMLTHWGLGFESKQKVKHFSTYKSAMSYIESEV